jgi:sugar lactone lactonase YvrE
MPGGCRQAWPWLESLERRDCPSVDLLVSCEGGDRVLDYDLSSGALIGEFVPAGYGGLQGPIGLTTGADGNVYVISHTNNNVLRYDSATASYLGDFVTAGSGGVFHPDDLAFQGDYLYVTSSDGGRNVLRYDATTGAFAGVFIPAGSGGLARPHGMTFGPDGNLYVNSAETHSVMRYDGTTGAPLPAPGRTGAYFVSSRSGGLDTPYGQVAFGRDGNLYVSGYYSNSVLRYDGTTGDFLDAFVPAGDHGLQGTEGICFGPDGNLYVVSQGTNSILRYDGTTGTFLDVFVPPGGDGLNAATYLSILDTGAAPRPPHRPPHPTPVAGDPELLFAASLESTTIEEAGVPEQPARPTSEGATDSGIVYLAPQPAGLGFVGQDANPDTPRQDWHPDTRDATLWTPDLLS